MREIEARFVLTLGLLATFGDHAASSTAEQWIREGMQALRCTRLSCRAFRDNAVRLQLFALAYNLANFLYQRP
jgi:hypothetical protein